MSENRTYGGELVRMDDAVDLHCHPFPDLFPRLADDIDIAIAARDVGMKAIVLKCHHENTVSRAYLVQRMVPDIRVFGGVVLNSYVGGLNPAAVEAALRLGGVEVWMPTVEAGYHAEVHGGTGGYDSQKGGRSTAEGIWVTDDDGRLVPEVKEVLDLVAQHGAILGTCHLSPREIVTLVKEACDVGVDKIVAMHPFFRVPNLDMDTIEEIARTIIKLVGSKSKIVYRPLPVDEWLVHEFTSHGLMSSRGLSVGHVFTRDGTHVATVTQEVLLRERR